MGTISEAKVKLEALEIIGRLGNGRDDERNEASKELIDFVKSRQKLRPKEILPETAFIVKKLVQGLSVDKPHKRAGFSTALCQILRTFHCIESSFVLSYIEENFQSMFKVVDTTNREIGRALGWIILINSQSFKTFTSEEINDLINNLLNSKPSVKLLCLTGLTEVISQVSHEVFKKDILPHLEEQLKSGWENCTPSILTILLVANKHHSSVLREIIKSHWKSDQLICEKNFARLADLLGKCSSCKNNVHPLVEFVLSLIKEDGLCVVKFWKEVGNPILISKINRGAKLVLGLNILTRILPDIKSSDKFREVINSDVSSALVTCMTSSTDEHKKAAQILVEKLTKLAVDSADKPTQVDVLKCLVQMAQSYVMIDIFNTFIKDISETSRAVYIEELLKTLVGKSSWIFTDPNESFNNVKRWCLRQLTYLCSVVEPSQVLTILQFMYLHSFFIVKQTNKEISHCVKLSMDLTHFERKMMMDTHFKLMSRLLTRRDKGVPKVKYLNQHLDVLYKLTLYVHTLLQSSCLEMLNTDSVQQIKKEWNKLSEVIKSIHMKKKEDEISDSHSFELLFICSGLQLLSDTESTSETLQDLYICYEKSKKKRKTQAPTDGPAWIDVIVEVMLSMVFKDNFMSRVLAKQVMLYLTDHVTTNSVQLLVDALAQTSAGNDEEMICVGDDDSDDEELNSDDEHGAMDVDEDSEGENGGTDNDDSEDNDDEEDDDNDDSDDDDSGIEEEIDLNVPDALKAKVKAALGDAAASSEDDEEDDNDDEVEFSDSEMFKLDKVLASAFKSMSKGKKSLKQRQLQLVSFKIKVLDLVEVVIKGNSKPSICTAFLLPLLHLFEKSVKKVSDEALGKKAQDVLEVLLKQKPTKAWETTDKDEWIKLLEEIMKYSKKVPILNFELNVSQAFLFVLKIILCDDGVSPLRTRSKPAQKSKGPVYYQDKVFTMIKTAVIELLEHKPGHCPSAFFHVILTEYPAIFWQLNEVFLNTMDSSDVKVYARTQAAAFLTDIVTKHSVDTVNTESWNQFVGKWKNTAHKVILEEGNAEKLSKGLLNEVVFLSYHLQRSYPELEVLSKSDLHILLEMRQKCDKSAKSVIRKLTKDLQRELKGPNVKKEKKRKHKENIDEVDGTSPAKKTNCGNQPKEPSVNRSSKYQAASSHENLNGVIESETTEVTPKKQKNKKKSETSEMNVSVDNGTEKVEKDLNITEESSKLDQSIDTPSINGSSKKRKKNKKKDKKKEVSN